MKTLTQIQQEYIDTCNTAMDRWSHRKGGGQSHRTIGAARKKAMTAFRKFGCFSEDQVRQMMRDAQDLLELERAAVDDELNHATD